MITFCCLIAFVVLVLITIIFYLILCFDKSSLLDYAVYDKFSQIKNIENMGHVNYEKEINKFYNGAPQRGYYIDHLKKVEKDALEFLKRPIFSNLVGKTVVMDVDDTLVWTRPFKPISKGRNYTSNFGNVVHYDPLPPMVSLAKKIQKLGYNLVIVTARGPHMMYDTVTNLNSFGIYPDKTFTSVYYGQDQTFKAEMRKNMETTDLASLQQMDNTTIFSGKFKKSKSPANLKVILSIGDRWQDITGMPNTLGLKLPDPRDMNSYFLYNKEVRIL